MQGGKTKSKTKNLAKGETPFNFGVFFRLTSAWFNSLK
jgi:hypothetical protein